MTEHERQRPADTAQVVLDDEQVAAWWESELNVSRDRLEAAIAEVGPLAVDVQNLLSRQEAER